LATYMLAGQSKPL